MPQDHHRPAERPPLEVLTAGDRSRAELIALPAIGGHGRRRAGRDGSGAAPVRRPVADAPEAA
ncbi:hypothetical protein [Patulibacter medicamentivorans]|uniref:hypothetical protein n=1 Tax=Patulibacter medicamentivorans TaxID=1097667 RepID=UPI00058F24EB|nr:hypothetical protein [Patulibacter medicamentivorans]